MADPTPVVTAAGLTRAELRCLRRLAAKLLSRDRAASRIVIVAEVRHPWDEDPREHATPGITVETQRVTRDRGVYRIEKLGYVGSSVPEEWAVPHRLPLGPLGRGVVHQLGKAVAGG